jgi:DNA modification methylase
MSDNNRITWSNEKRKLSELIPWPRNPRQIKVDQVKRLQESLDEFGQPETIAIGPGNEIYNGHQRLKSWADKFGDIEVDVRVSDRALTEKEREKLTVFLHKGAAGEWDFDALANNFEIDDLLDWGFSEMELEIGGYPFAEEVQEDDPGAQIDRAEELREKWGVESGQLWRLGDHRLICGDCTDAEVVERLMDGEKAGAVVTDPPYGQDQEDVPHDSPEEHADLLQACVDLLPIENGIVMVFQSPRLFGDWLNAIQDHRFLRALWLYKEAQETFPWRGWILKSEIILVSEVGKGKWLEVHPYSHDCYKVAEVSYKTENVAAVRTHGSIKPLTVIQDLVSRVGGDVYDPFLGSGTTLIACERLGRKCRAVEISPAYCAVAIQRWVDMTGGEPELIDEE